MEQPFRSRLCGQTAVAMLAGVTLDEACAAVGHRHGTRTRELVAALRTLGLTPEAERCWKRPRPDFGLAQVHAPGRAGWHWIAVSGELDYDGTFGVLLEGWRPPGEGRITSYLPVTRPTGQQPTLTR